MNGDTGVKLNIFILIHIAIIRVLYFSWKNNLISPALGEEGVVTEANTMILNYIFNTKVLLKTFTLIIII